MLASKSVFCVKWACANFLFSGIKFKHAEFYLKKKNINPNIIDIRKVKRWVTL
jgi:hypothetical protein